MLTKGDLSQIQKIVQSETRKIVQSETRKIVHGELKPIISDIKKIKSDISLIVRSFDRDYVVLRRRVDRIEDHLHLSSIPSS